MEPIVTLPYSEWLVAEHLMKVFPLREGYSVYAPLSRQEKGVDLILGRRTGRVSRIATLQVKFSRVWEQRPGRGFRFETLFRTFPVGDLADFFVLTTLFPNITGRGDGKRSAAWRPLLLVFGRTEMADLMSSLRTRAGGVDRMFGFGFDSPERVLHTRGAIKQRDVTKFTFVNRMAVLRKHLGAA